MIPLINTLQLVLDVAFTLLLVHVIMSWLINFQVLNLGQPLVAQIWQGLNKLFEPVFRPVRNILPNTHPLDLAPLVVFIIIIALRDYFLPSLY
ncbi:YggT family protein [Lentibacter sp.]|uniref:YggT family protein n=1 Tax=Lentibacter sp. TaxID=2024994 RepID=UPI003F6C897C